MYLAMMFVTFLVIDVFPYDVWHGFPFPEFC